jgi:AcrR family transcriptional regulator
MSSTDSGEAQAHLRTRSAEVGAIGLDLFSTRGFEATTVDDIAEAL